MEALILAGASASVAKALAARDEHVCAVSYKLLGGSKRLKYPMRSRSEVHAAILAGLPYASLRFLLTTMTKRVQEDVAKVLGVSTRALSRHTGNEKKPMPVGLASRAWLLAETLAKASEVLGSTKSAEDWMTSAVMGLDGQRPIDLLQTVQGAELVSEFLERVELGVYT